jgi:ankyrin repeat protein
VEQLLKAGADVHARHSNGMTALEAATRGGHEAIVRLLRDAGARR